MGDRRLDKAVTDCKLGGIDAAVTFFTENATPDLIVIESDLSGVTLLEQVGRLAEVCEEGTEVLALGSVNDVQTYRSLVNEGVNDYLVAPFSAVQTLGRTARRSAAVNTSNNLSRSGDCTWATKSSIVLGSLRSRLKAMRANSR